MRRIVAAGILICVFVVVVAGSPVQLSYVTSESMEPTINEGDGYLLISTTDVEEGDIVTFHSDTRDEYVTHRVVGETDDGYITQGDNNPKTDQATGHPVITESHIHGKVLQLRGEPVILPQFGSVIEFLQAHWLIALIALLLVLGAKRGGSHARDITRANHLIGPLVVGAIGTGTIVLLFGAPAVTMSFVVVETPNSDGRVLTVDEPATRTMSFGLSQQPKYTYQFVEGDGVDIEALATNDGEYDVDVKIPPQTDVGPYHATIRVYRYPAILPYGMVASLHSVHPGAAALSIMSTIVAPGWMAFWLVGDGKKPISGLPRHTRWLGRR